MQALLLNNMLKSGNMNTLGQFRFLFSTSGMCLNIFFCPLLEIPCILTSVAPTGFFFSHSRFSCLPSLLVYSVLTVTVVVIISKIILFAFALLWPEMMCKKAWENKTLVMGSASRGEFLKHKIPLF